MVRRILSDSQWGVWRQDIDEKNLAIVVNRQHPHWRMLEGENSIENYLPHCVYNGVAEHRAARKKRLESDTVKRLKDNYLRVVFELLQSAEDEENGTGQIGNACTFINGHVDGKMNVPKERLSDEERIHSNY